MSSVKPHMTKPRMRGTLSTANPRRTAVAGLGSRVPLRLIVIVIVMVIVIVIVIVRVIVI